MLWEGGAEICEWGQTGESRLHQNKLNIKLHPKSPVAYLNLPMHSSVWMGRWITWESMKSFHLITRNLKVWGVLAKSFRIYIRHQRMTAISTTLKLMF